MFNLPVFVGIDYHTHIIQVCVMNQQGKILVNQSVPNDPESVFRVVAPFGNNISAAIEARTGVAEFAEELIREYHWSVELAHPSYVARMKQTIDKSGECLLKYRYDFLLQCLKGFGCGNGMPDS